MSVRADLPAVLTVEEAAELLRIGRSAAYQGIKAGEIPSIKVGRSIRVPTFRLEQLLGEVTPDTSNALAGENQGAATTSTAGTGGHGPE
jgi:excisionase family DNA binding protein